MTRVVHFPAIACIRLMVALVAGAVSAGAGLVLDEPFTAPVGGRPALWTWVDLGRTAPTIREDEVGMDGRAALRVGRQTYLFYEPSGGADPAADLFANMQGSMVINSGALFDGGHLGGVGFMIRFNRMAESGAIDPSVSVPGTNGEPGYKIIFGLERHERYPFIGVFGGQNNSTLMTEDNVNRHHGSLQPIDAALIDDNTDYRFEFTAFGKTITASLWTIGEEPELLATTALQNAVYTHAGYFGVMGHSDANTKYAYISDLLIDPEPTVAGGIAFVDRTEELFGSSPGNHPASWVDFNNNGWPDLVVNGRIWINHEGEGFTQLVTGLDRVVAADFDNDGWVDLFSYTTGRMYRNVKGTGVEEIPMPPLPEGYVSRGAAAADFTGNGFVDIYIGGYEVWSDQITFPDILLINLDGQNFEIGWSETVYRARGVTACDFNEDGAVDVYVSNYRLMQNRLWLNDGHGGFTDVAGDYEAHGGGSKTATYGSAHTIGSVWGDFNGNGHFDLFVGNFSHPGQPESRFLRNKGPAGGFRFEDMGTGGVYWQESYASPVAGDFNNDGKLDLYFTTVYSGDYPALFRNLGGFRFLDVTTAAALPPLQDTYQAAVADFNRNGQLDLLTAGRLFVNKGTGNRFLKVYLKGDGYHVNRSAIGAQARVHMGDTVLVRQVEAGTGQGNQNDLALHFGLGWYDGPVSLEVNWPDGTSDTVTGLLPDVQELHLQRTPLELPYEEDFEDAPVDASVDALTDWIAGPLDDSRVRAHSYTYDGVRPLPESRQEQVLRLHTRGDWTGVQWALPNAVHPRLYFDGVIRFEPFTTVSPIDEADEEVKLALYLNDEAHLVLYHGGSRGDAKAHTVLSESIKLERWYRMTVYFDLARVVAEGGDEVYPFFQVRFDGKALSHDTEGYAEPSAAMEDYAGGSWFRFVHRTAQVARFSERRLSSVRFRGSAWLDELVLTDSEPAYGPLTRHIRTVLGPGGSMDPPGVGVTEPFASREIEVQQGQPVSITYTADDWHVIDALHSDGLSIPAATGATQYVWTVESVAQDIQNQVHFAEEIWSGDERTPLWWAHARDYSDGDALTVYAGYLLNQENLNIPFKIIETGLDEQRRPFVRWLSTGPAAGSVRGVSTEDLADPAAGVTVPGVVAHEQGTNTWTALEEAPQRANYYLVVGDEE